MTTVYSTQLFKAAITGVGSFVTKYTAPVGKVVVVRDMQITQLTTGSFFSVRAASAANIYTDQSTVGVTTTPWAGRVVLNAGDTLDVFLTNTATAQIIVSGYVLDA